MALQSPSHGRAPNAPTENHVCQRNSVPGPQQAGNTNRLPPSLGQHRTQTCPVLGEPSTSCEARSRLSVNFLGEVLCASIFVRLCIHTGVWPRAKWLVGYCSYFLGADDGIFLMPLHTCPLGHTIVRGQIVGRPLLLPSLLAVLWSHGLFLAYLRPERHLQLGASFPMK